VVRFGAARSVLSRRRVAWARPVRSRSRPDRLTDDARRAAAAAMARVGVSPPLSSPESQAARDQPVEQLLLLAISYFAT
jgi:hypothetical protein